jgi:hypothetical protein
VYYFCDKCADRLHTELRCSVAANTTRLWLITGIVSMVRPPPQEDPAEGSRETIDRELTRQPNGNKGKRNRDETASSDRSAGRGDGEGLPRRRD